MGADAGAPQLDQQILSAGHIRNPAPYPCRKYGRPHRFSMTMG